MSAAIPLVDNPISLFNQWMEEARAAGIQIAEAVSLATVDPEGFPTARVVLVKEATERGVVFYTNAESPKGRHLRATGKAALCAWWEATGRQVRLRGTVEEVTAEEADAYFATRPRISRLGAWASRQSEEIASRDVLEARVEEYSRKYPGEDIPRPPHWTGFRLRPLDIEFWREGAYRLHDRLLYIRDGEGWKTKILSP